MITIQTDREALFLATKMEEFAVDLYHRAFLLLTLEKDDPELVNSVAELMNQEKRHLQDFQKMQGYLSGQNPEKNRQNEMVLSAVAEGILFEGGLMGALRRGMFKTVEEVFAGAEKAEQNSIATYTQLAEQTSSPEAAHLLKWIAKEEGEHLKALQQKA